jgi:hypothetical protein
MPLATPLVLTALALASTSGLDAAAASDVCDRYAAPGGNDRAAGTLKRPFATPERLARALRPGRTGCLRGGSYRAGDDEYVLRIERGGRPGKPITVRSAPGERAHLRGVVMVTRGADRVRLSRLRIEGVDGEHNTVKIYAKRTVLERSDITNRLRGESCLILGSSYAGRAIKTLIRGNVFHDCGAPANSNEDHAIYAAHTSRLRVAGNLFFNSVGQTIQLYPDAQRSRIVRNVIDGGPDTVRGGIVIGGGERTASSRNLIAHNVITHAPYGVYGYWPGAVGRGNIVRDNCTWGADAGGGDGGLRLAGNVVADPLFRDRAGGDYRFEPGSKCRGVIRRVTGAGGR